MFVPVSCTSCGKPFQVPGTALGRVAPCPWCGALVTALPVSAPLPTPPAETAPPQPALPPPPLEPLWLDEPPPVPRAKPVPARPAAGSGSRRREPKPDRRFPFVPVAVGLVLLVVCTAATVVVLSYGSGRVPDAGWVEFTPPDGSFTIALPGGPAETPVDADPAGSVTGGRRYTVRGWYSKTTAWVEYADLDPAVARTLPTDRDRSAGAAVLQAAAAREAARLAGTVDREARLTGSDWWGFELQLTTPQGKAVVWVLLAGNGAHPRVYVFGAAARAVTPESPLCRRLYDSFRLNG